MGYTVKKLAKLSGVSVRTLHFYDETGLLKPASYGENGYRYYDQEQLLKLQQILFFRELGFKLSDIKPILESDDFNKVKALRVHRSVLETQAHQTTELISTIDKTIASLTGGEPMKPQELYLGFDKAKQEENEQYWVTRYGEKAKKLVAESKRNTKDWKPSDYDSAKSEFERLDEALAALIEQKESPDSPTVQDIVRRHYRLIQRFFDPSKKVYLGLGELYVTNPDFRVRYDSRHPKLAEFWNEAMKHFAGQEMK
jgi:MerR family transcriptional regulator, thiopeptide resistance regulator